MMLLIKDALDFNRKPNQTKPNQTRREIETMNKITVGFVVQEYDENGKCISSEFIAGDQTWEDDMGETIDEPDNAECFPLSMVQP